MRDTSDNLIITFGGIAFKSQSILQDNLRLFGLKPAISLMALGQTSLSTACFSAAECIKAGGLLGAARRSRTPVKGPLQTCFSGPLSPPWCCSAVTTLSLLARTQKYHVNMPTQEPLDKQSYQATSSFIHLPGIYLHSPTYTLKPVAGGSPATSHSFFHTDYCMICEITERV